MEGLLAMWTLGGFMCEDSMCERQGQVMAMTRAKRSLVLQKSGLLR